MARPIPPHVQALLDALKAAGAKVEGLNDKDDCGCPVCTQRRAQQEGAGEQKFAGGERFPPAGETAQSADPMDALADFLSELTGLPKERVLDIRKLAEASARQAQESYEQVDRRSLNRDTSLRHMIDELRSVTATLEARANQNRDTFQQAENRNTDFFNALSARVDEINELRAELADLQERFRKQVGLLHKRVTKRKGEIAVTTAATASIITKTRKRGAAKKSI